MLLCAWDAIYLNCVTYFCTEVYHQVLISHLNIKCAVLHISVTQK